MGAGALTTPPPQPPIRKVPLKALPSAIDTAIYIENLWPLILDPSGLASRFLKYQRGSYLLGYNPSDMNDPEKLRKLLVSALANGSSMVISYNAISDIRDLTKYFKPSFFPEEILCKNSILDEGVWSTLLRPENGDRPAHEFIAQDGFCFIVVVSGEGASAETLPNDVYERFHVIKVEDVDTNSKNTSNNNSKSDPLDVLFPTSSKEVKKNSKDLVEAGFDGDMDLVINLLGKGFHVDSSDGRGHTALSEASSQGHDDIITHLLSQGADPNLTNDAGRSAMYRACFNGKPTTVNLLLEAGGDKEIVDKSNGERPFDVCKDNETRDVLKEWDYTKTTVLVAARAEEIKRSIELRITTAVEREDYARMLISQELCAMAEKGDIAGLKKQLLELSEEATNTNHRPLTTCESRNPRGQTLLSLACQYNHMPIVSLLCEHWKTCDVDDYSLSQGEHSWEYRTFKANVNSRDNKGWNVAAICAFHQNVNALRMVLDNQADPNIKNVYRKSAVDLCKDDLDAALNVVVDKSEIRKVIEEWDGRLLSKTYGTGGTVKHANGAGKCEALPSEGSGIAMQIEMRKDAEAIAAASSKKVTKKTLKKGGKKGGKKT